MKKHRTQYYFIALIIWSLFIAFLIFYDINKIRQESENNAIMQARSNFNNIRPFDIGQPDMEESICLLIVLQNPIKP